MLSRPCAYAIRALAYLATQPPGKLSGAREISEHEGIPASFLSKVLVRLRRGRLVRSYKGIGGGYELAQPPNRVTLFSVVVCMEGEETFRKCILQGRDCATHDECMLHGAWGKFRDELRQFLEQSTLVEMIPTRQIEMPRELGVGASAQLNGPIES